MDLGVWELWRTRFFPTWLEPGGEPGSGLPLAQTTPAAKRSPFSSPPAPQPWAFRAPELPASCARSAHSRPGLGFTVVKGREGLLGYRLASAADARHPVARSGRTAGGGAPRPAVMDGVRSGARKAIYRARAHRDRFGPAE